MKKNRLTAPAVVLLSLTMAGCITTRGNDAYVDGRCITCWQNPFETQQASPGQTGPQGRLAADGCRQPISNHDQTHHFRDKRWCDDITLPGATFSQDISIAESVPVGVDRAYINAKRFLNFSDPDDGKNGAVHTSRRWDSIPSTYYNVVAMYGGPMQHMLWYAEYDLQLERVASNRTKVRLKYRTYGRNMDPTIFQRQLLQAIKGQ